MKKKGSYSKRLKIDTEQIINMYVNQNWSASRIATEFDVAPSTVRWRLMQAGAYAGDTRKTKEYNKRTVKKNKQTDELKCEICKGIVKNGVCNCCGRTIAQMVAERK